MRFKGEIKELSIVITKKLDAYNNKFCFDFFLLLHVLSMCNKYIYQYLKKFLNRVVPKLFYVT